MEYISLEREPGIPSKWRTSQATSPETDKDSSINPGFTLILPSVSVGNVGQLSCDLLINTLYMYRVGYLDSACVHPVVGNDPFSAPAPQRPKGGSKPSCDITTAMEVYESENLGLVLIQLRAPLLRGRGQQFVKEMAQFIENCGFSRVVILSSSFAHCSSDEEALGPRERYLASNAVSDEARKNLESAGIPYLVSVSPKHNTTLTPRHLPGSGFALPMFDAIQSSSTNGCSVVLLNAFVQEGDNLDDAVGVSCALDRWLHLIDRTRVQHRVVTEAWTRDGQQRSYEGTFEEVQEELERQRRLWKYPSSWKMLFGADTDGSLYQ